MRTRPALTVPYPSGSAVRVAQLAAALTAVRATPGQPCTSVAAALDAAPGHTAGLLAQLEHAGKLYRDDGLWYPQPWSET